jgi:gentisate 1,2-dioxygenase
MLHGVGAYTTVEGHKFVMKRGDLVITPSFTWHDHGNEGREPVLWTDGLDSPLVRYLENLSFEPFPGETQPVRTGAPLRHWHHRWDAAHAEILRRAETERDPYDDVLMEYLDPDTGRSVVPSFGCYLQLLRPGVRTHRHRETSSAVYHVVEGTGWTEIDGARYEWDAGDFFAIPPRALHAHGNDGRDPAILYSLQDVPLLRALGLYRMEAA